jgi:hypothetical protein
MIVEDVRVGIRFSCILMERGRTVRDAIVRAKMQGTGCNGVSLFTMM